MLNVVPVQFYSCYSHVSFWFLDRLAI